MINDISEGIGTNKISDSHECRIYHYRYFFKLNFTYQPLVYNDDHGLRQKSMSLNNKTSENMTNNRGTVKNTEKGFLKTVDCIMEKTKRDLKNSLLIQPHFDYGCSS